MKMETYFEKYPEEMNAAEVESPVSEENFMRFYHRRVRGRRIRIAAAALVAAVACVAVILFAPARPATEEDIVDIYIKEYMSAVRPIYDELVNMESQSELYSELGLSSVMRELVQSIGEFNGELEGLDGDTRMEMVRRYCEGQRDKFAELYAECMMSREIYR